jgi:uncharacterized protein (DUF2062 family)
MSPKPVINLRRKLRIFFRGKWLQGHWLHRLFGKYITASDLWHLNRRSFTGGLALGLFIAFTPTIPFQIFLVALGAMYFRVHLPTALAASCVTNPLTAVPVYLSAWQLGWWILRQVNWIRDLIDINADGRMMGIMLSSMALWIGSLIYAIGASLLSYVLINWFWKKIERHVLPFLSYRGSRKRSKGRKDE